MSGSPPHPSLESVVQRFGRMVLSIGRRAGLDEADLDELIQAVRVRLWRTQGETGGDGVVSATYVHQTARSAAIDIVRARRGLMASASESIEAGAPLADAAVAPDTELEQREAADRILAIVDTLPPDRRSAVKLHLAGYRRDEISEMLGWSETRTRNLIHRGVTELRTRLVALGLAPTGAP